jgi:c-di-GMP-binding flagellar brake protein YcgR
MEKLRFAIVSQDNDNRYDCSKLLYNHDDVITEIYESFEQFRENSDEKEYSGIIIDLHTIVISSMEDKEFFYSISKGLPVITVNSSEKDLEISFYVKGKYIDKPDQSDLIDYFIYEICAKNTPRRIRRYRRKNIHFNVTIFRKNGKLEKTNLLNISEGGYFIITSNKPENKIISFTIDDLEDKTPIEAEIKWVMNWGEKYTQLPGYALQFNKISKAHKDEIIDIINSN